MMNETRNEMNTSFQTSARAKILLNKKTNLMRLLVTFSSDEKITQRNADLVSGDFNSIDDLPYQLARAAAILRTQNIRFDA